MPRLGRRRIYGESGKLSSFLTCKEKGEKNDRKSSRHNGGAVFFEEGRKKEQFFKGVDTEDEPCTGGEPQLGNYPR